MMVVQMFAIILTGIYISNIFVMITGVVMPLNAVWMGIVYERDKHKDKDKSEGTK